MTNGFTRREILKLSSLLTASAFIPRIAFAVQKPAQSENFFVLLRLNPMNGGFDVTLGLDPWLAPQRPLETDMFVEYQPNDITTVGGINLGPAAKSLAPFANDALVLNGVFMSETEIGHPSAIQYMTSGDGQGKSADAPVEFEYARGVYPYGVISGAELIFPGPRRIPYVKTSDVLSSLHAVDPTEALKNAVQDPRSPLERSIQEVVSSKDVTVLLRKQLVDLETQKIELKSHHVAAASFLSGAGRHAEIDLRTNGVVDTHSNHEGTHLASQGDLWKQVAEVMAFFKSVPYGQGSLFDRTTFMCIADFSRTPALNASRGKDHNPMTNSIFFAGYGVKKNTTINSSLLITAARSKSRSSYHMASPFDYATGLPATSRVGANFIYPQNVVATVATAIGVDMSKFESVPKGTALIPGFMA